MSKQENNSLDGITVGGVPLENILEDEDEKQRAKDTTDAAGEDAHKQKGYRRPSHPGTSGEGVDRKTKRRGEVHTLSAREKNQQYWREMLRALVAQQQPVSMLIVQRMLSGESSTVQEHLMAAADHGGVEYKLNQWQSLLTSTWKRFPIWYLINRKHHKGNAKKHSFYPEVLDLDVDTLSMLTKARGWKKLKNLLEEFPGLIQYYPDKVRKQYGLMNLEVEAEEEAVEERLRDVGPPEVELPPVAAYDGEPALQPVRKGDPATLEYLLVELRTAALRAGMIVEVNFKSI